MQKLYWARIKHSPYRPVSCNSREFLSCTWWQNAPTREFVPYHHQCVWRAGNKGRTHEDKLSPTATPFVLKMANITNWASESQLVFWSVFLLLKCAKVTAEISQLNMKDKFSEAKKSPSSQKIRHIVELSKLLFYSNKIWVKEKQNSRTSLINNK